MPPMLLKNEAKEELHRELRGILKLDGVSTRQVG